jgi:glucokinase
VAQPADRGADAQALGLPVQLDNDANVAAYGEYRFGAGRGYRLVLLVTVGTGLGGGIVSDGRLVRGANGFAAEVGHVVLQPDGLPCGCGNAGCWEQMASGTAIGRLAARRLASGPTRSHRAHDRGDPEAATGRSVPGGARGDASARRILAEVGRWLGIGLAGLANILDRGVIVAGGGTAAAGDLLLEPARQRSRTSSRV